VGYRIPLPHAALQIIQSGNAQLRGLRSADAETPDRGCDAAPARPIGRRLGGTQQVAGTHTGTLSSACFGTGAATVAGRGLVPMITFSPGTRRDQ
jgi:hypothetical protein